jgi:radical SAM protein with 4Fe4S-binding SPASM domain
MDCPHITSIGYAEFRGRVRSKIGDERTPLAGSLELTFRCNLRCRHCYVAHGHTGIPGRQELNTAEIDRILGEAADGGCLWMLLTGGEPLVRRDFLEIWTAAKRRGFLVTLFTNGTLLTPAVADALVEYRPFNLEITLYGATQATYERVTGVPGSYDRCMHGIALLQERQIPFSLKTMVLTLNRHELSSMQSLARGLGCDFRYDAMINAGADGSGRPVELRITPQEVVELDLADPTRAEGWRALYNRSRQVRPDPRYLYACGAGLHSFHIDPYGGLSLCMMPRHVSYDLRRGSFRQGWREFLWQERFRSPRGNYECSGCSLMGICGQCPGWAQMEHGEEQKPVPYLCQVAHLRATALKLDDGEQPLAGG